jgi:hypothetical protein
LIWYDAQSYSNWGDYVEYNIMELSPAGHAYGGVSA